MFTIRIELLSYWHAGTGKSAGSKVDSLVEKDVYGLPFLSGRTLKGLLRDAVYSVSQFDWFVDRFGGDVVELVFGTRGDGTVQQASMHAGILRVGDARLPKAEHEWLAHTEQGRSLIPALYREVYSTAIDPVSGAARDKSLRGAEVTIPCMLEADIDMIPPLGNEPVSNRQRAWIDSPDRLRGLLETVLPLVDAVGANRSRGYGRAQLTLEKVV